MSGSVPGRPWKKPRTWYGPILTATCCGAVRVRRAVDASGPPAWTSQISSRGTTTSSTAIGGPPSNRSTATPIKRVLLVVVEHVGQPVAVEDGPARTARSRRRRPRSRRHRVSPAREPWSTVGGRFVAGAPKARRRRRGMRSIMGRIVGAIRRAAKPPEGPGCASIQTMTNDTAPHRPTLMNVHAHPDDETIGTGGAMAKAVEAGHRVILVTGTRGELGEIVVPDMDTPDNHRRLGEIRAGELERAMGHLGVTEWENLGYRDSGMMGTDGNHDPRSFWKADLDEAAGPAGLVRADVPAGRHHDLQRVRRLRPPRPHPDPRRRGPGVRAGRRSGLVSRSSSRPGSRCGRHRSCTSRRSRDPSARR